MTERHMTITDEFTYVYAYILSLFRVGAVLAVGALVTAQYCGTEACSSLEVSLATLAFFTLLYYKYPA
jgi:hypothetical protein